MTNKYQIYYDRWQALDKRIAELSKEYAARPAFPRQDVILHLANNLRAYGKGHFHFFYVGLDPQSSLATPSDPVLQPARGYPPEDILTAVLDQIAHDLDLIQRIASQRSSSDQVALQTLANTDKLAWLAMQKAIEYEVIRPPATVLTYFEKSAEFYTIPYAEVAVIAVPYTSTMQGNEWDYLAIPHEVGHYVYRHAQNVNRKDLHRLRNSSAIPENFRAFIKHTFEEMCADIYGCLIAGPVMALDFQTLMLDNSKEDMMGFDGQHPNPAIRPRLYCQVLSSPKMQPFVIGDWHTIAGLLNTQWDKTLKQRAVSGVLLKYTTVKAKDHTTTTSEKHFDLDKCINAKAFLSNPTAKTDLGPMGNVAALVIDMLLATLENYIKQHSSGGVTPILEGWAGLITANTTVQGLSTAYLADFANLLAQAANPPLPPDPSPTAVTSWATRVSNRNPVLAAAKGAPVAQTLKHGELKDPDKMKLNEWGFILYADGWTTGGPSDNNSGHPAV